MRVPCCRFILGLCLIGAAFASSAARVEGLYTAEVQRGDVTLLEPGSGQKPGAGQSEEGVRGYLMRAALARVLVRLTGDPEVLGDSRVRSRLLDEAPSLVNRFQYLQRGGPGDLRIRVTFNAEAVRSSLWEAGWSVWGPVRPDLLVWAAVRGDSGMELASPDSRPGLYKAMRRAAARYGLPLNIPLMDATDRRRLTGRNLLFEDWGPIERASERYGAQAILLLRATPPQGGSPARAEWVLRSHGQSASYRTSGGKVAAAVEAGMQTTLARLASRYAVTADSAVTLEAAIEGVSGLGDYARIEQALKALIAVEDATLLAVEGDRVRFRFRFRGRPEEAIHVLGLVGSLKPRKDGARAESDPPLRFTFRP